MAKRPLPTFRYHPDPVGTGSLVESAEPCYLCGEKGGYVYLTEPYGTDVPDDVKICPWCIADGRAHRELDASFTADLDTDLGLSPDPDAVPISVREEILNRTPGFIAWQQARWMVCCGDGCAFLGMCGRRELERHGPEAIAAIRAEIGYDDEQWAPYFEHMSKDGQPTAYLFRCLHCSAYRGFSDFT